MLITIKAQTAPNITDGARRNWANKSYLAKPIFRIARNYTIEGHSYNGLHKGFKGTKPIALWAPNMYRDNDTIDLEQLIL